MGLRSERKFGAQPFSFNPIQGGKGRYEYTNLSAGLRHNSFSMPGSGVLFSKYFLLL